jgi:hypothetical protein
VPGAIGHEQAGLTIGAGAFLTSPIIPKGQTILWQAVRVTMRARLLARMPTPHPFRRVLGAALFGWPALASSTLTQSMLGGVVRDPNGQVAADAPVVAENEKTGETSDARSSSIDLFAFYQLPPGTYTIRVTHPPLTFFGAGVKSSPVTGCIYLLPLVRISRHSKSSRTVRSMVNLIRNFRLVADGVGAIG